jgi:protein-L-isoaspartate(D-aspartate) O-methyltransferase
MSWPDGHERLRAMVDNQIAARGIDDRLVLRAMRNIDRAAFVPDNLRQEAYDDTPLPIGGGQTISQPYIVALMTSELQLTGSERVLEIGTGSGYQTALLASICREVYTMEFVPRLQEQARIVLDGLGFRNIHYRTGDGTLGWPQEAPFDRILAAAAAPRCPPPWQQQIADGGIILLPVGQRGMQQLQKIVRRADAFEIREFCYCNFVIMRGQYGFE